MAGRHDNDSFPGTLFRGAGQGALGRDLRTAARAEASVLLTGGHGRALRAARWLHDESRRRHRPFAIIDCSAPPAAVLNGLLEALGPRSVEAGAGFEYGTLFLGEVGALPPSVQRLLAELLTRRARSRVVASTRDPLMERVLDGRFDDCLYYRLNVIQIVLDP